MKNIFVKALAVLLVCMFVISGINFSIFASDAKSNGTDLGDKLKAMNVELSGRVKMQLYFTNVDGVDRYVVNVDGTTRSVSVSDMEQSVKNGTTRYKLEISLAAAQQALDVEVTPYSANGVKGKTRTKSIRDYVDLAVQQGFSESAIAALESMLNYGAMAQENFDYMADDLANAGLYFGSTNPVNNMTLEDMYGIKAEQKTATDASKLAFTALDGYLEDSVGLRCYINYTGNYSDLQVVIEGKNYGNEIFEDGTGRYILIDNIPATKFNYQYSIVVTDGTDSAAMKCSVLNYATLLINNNTDNKELLNTAYAMFMYYVKMYEYVNGENSVVGKPQVTDCEHTRAYVNNSYAKICSTCGKDITPTDIVENANQLANGVTSYFGTAAGVLGGDTRPTVDGVRDNYIVENSNMNFSYVLDSDGSQLATITNKNGGVYVQNTMDVYVKTSNGTYYAKNSVKDATANIYRYGYYYYDVHMYGQNFLAGEIEIPTTGKNFAANNLSKFNHMSKVSSSSTSVTAQITNSSDPYMYCSIATISSYASLSTYNAIQFTLTTTASTHVQIRYATASSWSSGKYTDDHMVEVDVAADGKANTYTVFFNETGVDVYGLRFDFNGTIGEQITISDIKFVTVESGNAPELLLDRGLHTYTDKMHQAISLVAPKTDVAVTEVGMTTVVNNPTQIYIKKTDGTEVTAISNRQTVTDVAYVGFYISGVGVFGYILPANVDNDGDGQPDYNNGTISVARSSRTYTITQTVIPTGNVINKQPAVNAENKNDANTGLPHYRGEDPTIGTSLNIYNSPSQFYFGQRIYTDTETDLEKFKIEAELERNPLGENNIKVNTDKTPGATFDGYDPIRGMYAFTIPDYIGFEDGYYRNQNFHGTVAFSITGDDKDRNMYVMAYTNGDTVEGGAVLDSNDNMLPIPTEVSKNFSHEFEEVNFLWGDIGYSEVRIPVKVKAGETQELSVLHLFMNWGHKPLKQISSIQFFAPYYHLSTGTTETNCIANYYVHGKDLDTLPDHRAMSGTWWADDAAEHGDPQHDNAGYHNWLQYTDSEGNKQTSEPIKSVINSSGPTYAEIDMTYVSDDGKIQVTYTHMEMPQVDETRTYYTMSYKILEDVTISDFANTFSFYSVYGYGKGYQKFGYYGANGAQNNISADTKATYTLAYAKNDGEKENQHPYFDMYMIDNKDGNGNQNKQNGNVSFLINDFSTTSEALQNKDLIVRVENRKASLSLNAAGDVTLYAGETITINAIIMPWGNHDSTNDQLVQNARQNTLVNPFKATAFDSNTTVDTTKVFLPTVKSVDGVEATFSIGNGNGGNHSKGINVTFRADGFKILGVPKLLESTDGGKNWNPVQISSINNPDRSGSAHEYDGYAVHCNREWNAETEKYDITYSYSFVTTITGADRLFKVVVDDVSVDWTENYGDSYIGPEALNKYASNGVGLTSTLNNGYVTITNANHEDPYFQSFALKPAPTARYLVIKYRMTDINTDLQFFMRTSGEINGDGDFFILSGSPIKKDGEWHVMAIDLAAIDSETDLSAMTPNADGAYTITRFRFDAFTTQTTNSYDIAYMAFCNDAQSVLDINPGVDAASIDHVTGRTKASSSFETVVNQAKEDNTGNAYDSLNGVFAGADLENAILTTGNKKYTTSLENGIVKFTKTESGEAYFTVLFNKQGVEPKVTGQYLVMKYRTNCAALKSANVYTGTEGYGATSDAQRLNGLNMISDGQWHVAYYDLSAASSVVAAADGKYYVNFVRIDAGYHLAVGDSIEYAYIGICDDINKIPLEGGELVEVNLNKANNADGVYADGNRDTNLKGSTIINATTVQYNGWIGIAGKSVNKMSCVVSDMFGDKTAIEFAATSDANVANRYYDALSSQPHVDAVAGYGVGTVPYFVRFDVDLSAWAGQTVTISLVATVDNGSVQTWSIKVAVPVPEIEEPEEPGKPGWLDGEALLGALNTAQFSGTLNDDGSLTITSKDANGDGALVLTNLANGLTPKYAVIKYKTSSGQNDLSLLATTGENSIGGYVTSTVKTDGEWHTILLDLRLCNGYNYGDSVSFMRLDVCEGAVGNNMTIDYVYLCENIDELSGVVIDTKYSNNNDYLYVDGGATNFKGSTSLNGTIIDYTGWVGVSGFASEGISYVVTDANGNETEVALMDSTTAVKRYYEDNNITTHLINNSKFSEGTKGYQVRFTADLIEWAGQTVTLSIRETITGGAIVETYSVQVTVPEGNFTITGADLKNFVISSMHNYVVNADGSLTVTWKAGSDTYLNNFASLLNGMPAPRYAVLKYKTTTESGLVMLANTTGAAGPYVGVSTHTDGQWQYAIFDLTTVTNSAYTVGETVAFMRINCCNAEGDNLSIGQIEFCDDLEKSMFHRVLADTFTVDGVESKGAMEVTGSNLHFGGWAGVNGRQATAISYVVTDKNGVETVVPCGGWNFNRTDLTAGAAGTVFGANYSAATKGFGGSVDADLSAWYGQTVTFSIRATLDNGKTADVYTMTVNVPESANPNYVTGSEMIAGLNTSGFSSTLNSDGSVTINCIAGADGTITFNSIMSGTPKYAVIRYKNTNTPQLVIYATTAGKNHKETYVTLQKDNVWHTAVVDLEAVGSYTAGDAINLLRFDFLDSGDGSYVGNSLTLDYVWFTDDISNVKYDVYDKLNVSYVGQGIVDMATTGSWDHGIANAVVNADGTVTITTDNSGDSYFGNTFNGTIATGNYLVLKYRSGEGVNVRGGKFNALAASQGNAWSVGGHIPMGYAVADHNWHVLVINYADLASVTAIDGVYYMTDWRVDLINQFVPGSSIDFAYIGFCDDLGDIILEEGEYLEYAWQSYYMSPDNVQIDGAQVTTDGFEYKPNKDSCGASDRSYTYTGTTWSWVGGWFAIDNQAVTDLSICVTDENGVEHWSTVTYTDTAWSGGNWWIADDITTHNINNNGFGANTVGYRITNITADLSAYAGQTVTVSLRTITEAGHAAVIYSAFVTVPN